MPFDFKKEYQEFYLPKLKSQIVTVPKASYVALRGKGDPNEEGGAYKAAVSVLYAVAYTVKMSKMGDHRIDGYYDFVVPPLEGFWWQKGMNGVDYTNKALFHWISAIRLPDFVTKAEFGWAVSEATRKKKLDCSAAEFLTIDEGLCVQCMHLGPFEEFIQPPLRGWMNSSMTTAMKTTFRRQDCTMRYISLTPARLRLKNGKP